MATQVASVAVSGRRAKPTANCWTTVLTLARLVAGTASPRRAQNERKAWMPSSRTAMITAGSHQNVPWATSATSAPEHEDLVGQRVEEGARAGGALPAGEEAVGPVGEAQPDPERDGGRRGAAAAHHRQERDREDQPADGEDVGRRGQRRRAELRHPLAQLRALGGVTATPRQRDRLGLAVGAGGAGDAHRAGSCRRPARSARR